MMAFRQFNASMDTAHYLSTTFHVFSIVCCIIFTLLLLYDCAREGEYVAKQELFDDSDPWYSDDTEYYSSSKLISRVYTGPSVLLVRRADFSWNVD